MQTIAILGSTGSIGTQALELVRLHPEEFRVVALTARSSREKLFEQVREFRPEVAGLTEPIPMSEIPEDVRFCRWVMGEEALRVAAAEVPADMVLVSVVGIAGLQSVMDALGANRQVLLANKEALVTGGELVMRAAKEKDVPLLPVDSEHSAIFQCLQDQHSAKRLEKILLTASGGPFFGMTTEQLRGKTKSDALKHPNWNMGAKITIDSATLMNKGLELIEAVWLFGLPEDKIQIVVQRESIVHSAVQFADHSVIAQLGVPDMRVPIAYAMTYPRRIPTGSKPLDLFSIGTLTFEPGDPVRFPALRLAGECLNAGGAACTILNGANEMAVAAFLRDEIPFGAISRIVEGTLEACGAMSADTLEDIFHADLEARRRAKEIAEKLK